MIRPQRTSIHSPIFRLKGQSRRLARLSHSFEVTLFVLMILLPTTSKAGRLEAKALFYRCYSQLTQTQPTEDMELTKRVIRGQVGPIEACVEVLDKAKFNSQGQIEDQLESLAAKVLLTMHNLHASWFQAKDFPGNFNNIQNRGVQAVYDNSAPALYFTRAFFRPSTRFESIFRSDENLIPIRDNSNPEVFSPFGSQHLKSQYPFDQAAFRFAPLGALLGVASTGPRTWSYQYLNTNNSVTRSGTLEVGRSLGGGVLGSPAYLLLTVDEGANFSADGAVRMPRKWSRDVITDLMCRELPLIRPGDADHLVVPTSSVEFRKTKDCNRCHASLDRMASTLRNLRFVAAGGNQNFEPPFGLVAPSVHSVVEVEESGWPAEPDGKYFRRPPKGTLFFRNYKGVLIDQPVSNVADLGEKLADQEDVYVCAASRYYEYFTGISTNVGDIGDTSLGYNLTEADELHRKIVINLGKRLKLHQSLRDLVIEILNLPHYKLSDLGISDSRGLASEK